MELRIRKMWTSPRKPLPPGVCAPRMTDTPLRRGLMRIIMIGLLPSPPRSYPSCTLPTCDTAGPRNAQIRTPAKVVPACAPVLSRTRPLICFLSAHGHGQPIAPARTAKLLPTGRTATSPLTSIMRQPRTSTISGPRTLSRRKPTAPLARLIPLARKRIPQTLQ